MEDQTRANKKDRDLLDNRRNFCLLARRCLYAQLGTGSAAPRTLVKLHREIWQVARCSWIIDHAADGP